MMRNNLSVRKFQRDKVICNEAHWAPPVHPPSQTQFIQNSTRKGWISEKPQASLFHQGLCQSLLQQQTPLSLPNLSMFPNGTVTNATSNSWWQTWGLCYWALQPTTGYSVGYLYKKQIGKKKKNRRYWRIPEASKPILISFEAQRYRS